MPEFRKVLCFRSPRPARLQAPLFVYLPGGDGTGQLLCRQLEGLEKAFDIRCLEIPPDDLTGWDELAEQVVQLVRSELEQKPRSAVYLCGESFGGCLALKVVRHAPELFDYLVLVNPASSFNRRLLLQWGSCLVRPVPEVLYRLFWLGFLPFLAALGQIESEDRQTLLTAVQSMTQETSIWRVRLLREFEMDDAELRQIQQPTLVIASGRDALLPSVLEAERLIELLPQAKMHLLPDSGHACLLEANVHLYDILQAEHFLLPVQIGAEA